MTVEKFLEVLYLIERTEDELDIEKTLDGILANLSSLVSSPGQAAQQTALAIGLAKLSDASAELGEYISPADLEVIDSMGGEGFFRGDLASRVSDSVSSNALTPSVARDLVQKLSADRNKFLEYVHETLLGLENLNVTSSKLAPGQADVAFVIPRLLFDNQLENFSKELKFISKLFGDYSEALLGEREQVRLETLSSSEPTVILLAAIPVLSAVGGVVNKFLDAWKKVEEIREVRARVASLGIKGAAYNEFTKQITETIDGVVEQSVREVIAKYKGESTRKNELSNALKMDTKKLFVQIERGMTVRFRASINEEILPANQPELVVLSNFSKAMEFPTPIGEPLLLAIGDTVIGDDDSEIHEVELSKQVKPKKSAKKAVGHSATDGKA